MKKILIAAFLIACFIVRAQEGDTAKAVPPIAPIDSVESPAQITVGETEENLGSPKIVYYQSTGTPRKYKKRKRRGDIKTLSGSMNHSGGFGALSFRSTEFNDESLVMAGVRGGWIINRTLGIGLEGHGVIPTTQFEGIEDGTDVNLLGGYGGMFLELIFFSNEVVHVTFPVSAGAGWLGYHRTSNNVVGGSEVDSDVFWYVEPGASLEFNISRNFRLSGGVSKRFTQDFELQNTDMGAFEKLNYFITLKIGGF
ncbi:MAG: hypothetical protein AAF616_09370 [Bacteroidota bacterium]